jgi:ribosomal-protein-alanine N-acetyltransferase
MTIDIAFRAFPTLETPRLHLRRIGLEDTNAILALYGSEAVAQYLDIDTLVDGAGAEELAAFFVRSYDKRFAIRWAITLRADGCTSGTASPDDAAGSISTATAVSATGPGVLIGTCGYNGLDPDNRRAEIGYDLLAAFWRRGIMTEALHAILAYAFGVMELHRVEAVTAPANRASAALLRALGFHYEGCLRQRSFYRGAFRDDDFYGLLRAEYAPPFGEEGALPGRGAER